MGCWTADDAKSGRPASRKRRLPWLAREVQNRRWCAPAFSEAPGLRESCASELDSSFPRPRLRVRENAQETLPAAAQTCVRRCQSNVRSEEHTSELQSLRHL